MGAKIDSKSTLGGVPVQRGCARGPQGHPRVPSGSYFGDFLMYLRVSPNVFFFLLQPLRRADNDESLPTLPFRFAWATAKVDQLPRHHRDEHDTPRFRVKIDVSSCVYDDSALSCLRSFGKGHFTLFPL